MIVMRIPYLHLRITGSDASTRAFAGRESKDTVGMGAAQPAGTLPLRFVGLSGHNVRRRGGRFVGESCIEDLGLLRILQNLAQRFSVLQRLPYLVERFLIPVQPQNLPASQAQ
jgi:hypothetical protein